jgi:hypothetical protein
MTVIVSFARTTLGWCAYVMLDARSGDPRVDQFWGQGFDLNEGMLFVYQGKSLSR